MKYVYPKGIFWNLFSFTREFVVVSFELLNIYVNTHQYTPVPPQIHINTPPFLHKYTSIHPHSSTNNLLHQSGALWICLTVTPQLRELEAELEAEQRKARDLATENRKLLRLLQEQKSQSDEDRRVAAELNEQVNSLNIRLKALKRQLEEAVSTSFSPTLPPNLLPLSCIANKLL